MIGVLSRKAFYNVRFSLRISDILLLHQEQYRIFASGIICGYEDDTDEGNTKHHRPKRTEQALYGE